MKYEIGCESQDPPERAAGSMAPFGDRRRVDSIDRRSGSFSREIEVKRSAGFSPRTPKRHQADAPNDNS